MASLPEGKSWGLCLAQLCAKYRLVSAMLSPYHLVLKIEEAASLKLRGSLKTCHMQQSSVVTITPMQGCFPLLSSLASQDSGG